MNNPKLHQLIEELEKKWDKLSKDGWGDEMDYCDFALENVPKLLALLKGTEELVGVLKEMAKEPVPENNTRMDDRKIDLLTGTQMRKFIREKLESHQKLLDNLPTE